MVAVPGTAECASAADDTGIAFQLTTLVVVATPGTSAVYSIAARPSRGSKATHDYLWSQGTKPVCT